MLNILIENVNSEMSLFGINKSQLKVIGLLKCTVFCDKKEIGLNLYVVQDNTII